MNPRFKQGMVVIGVAAILAYMGLISLSDVRDYVAWPLSLLELSIAAALCGILLAMAEENAIRLLAMASVLSAVLFGGFWVYASWALLGQRIPFVELILSDLVFLYIIQRAALLITSSLVFGLLGAVCVQIFLPKHLRP